MKKSHKAKRRSKLMVNFVKMSIFDSFILLYSSENEVKTAQYL